MSTEAARTARELQMLEGLVDCAHALGMAVGTAAKAETDVRASLAGIAVFQKCFLAVRMGIRLCMSLRAGRSVSERAATVERPDTLEQDPAEHDPSEAEAQERPDPVERERDREYEPVSLPAFLKTLGVVARDAAQLDGRLPPEARQALPALQDLLAQADPAAQPARHPPAGVAVLVRPAPPGRTRDKLLGSAAVASSGPRRPRPRSGLG